MGPSASANIPLDLAIMLGTGLVSSALSLSGLYWFMRGRIARNSDRISVLEDSAKRVPTTGAVRQALKDAEEAHRSATKAHERIDAEEDERQKLALEHAQTATMVRGLTASIDGRLGAIEKGLGEVQRLLIQHVTKGQA